MRWFVACVQLLVVQLDAFRVSLEEWIRYYEEVSCYIDSDAYFVVRISRLPCISPSGAAIAASC